jgi:hypothetical protein
MSHVIFGSYNLKGMWHLVVDIRQNSPVGSTMVGGSSHDDYGRSRGRSSGRGRERGRGRGCGGSTAVATITTKKEQGQVKNYTPLETYELFGKKLVADYYYLTLFLIPSYI